METTRASLLVRIKDPGDSSAWTTFDAIYRPLLDRYARARGLTHADAEDVVQHCMSAIARHIKSFDYDPATGRFKGWLKTLVNNRITDLFRKKSHVDGYSAALDRLQHREPQPDAIFEQMWMEQHLKRALKLVRQEVEEHSFRAYQLYVVEQRPAEKVCQLLGLNANQLYSIRWRINRKIREYLKHLTADMES
jgi:RNA polymerase sigma-70 factor (ECF subfamily)